MTKNDEARLFEILVKMAASDGIIAEKAARVIDRLEAGDIVAVTSAAIQLGKAMQGVRFAAIASRGADVLEALEPYLDGRIKSVDAMRESRIRDPQAIEDALAAFDEYASEVLADGTAAYLISSQRFKRGDDAVEDYSERLVQSTRPHCWQPCPAAVAPASREEFGLPTRGSFYFCPHRLAKFHPDFDPLLRRILQEDPDGHLVVLEGRPRPTAALRARWDRTIGKSLATRVLFVPHQRPEDYGRLLCLATAVLDVPACSSCLTGYDALACGVPLVTLPGRYMVQRYVAGLYAQMGIQDLVAADEDDYVRLAVELGRNGDFRAAMSRQIAERGDVHFEDDAVVREYEAFFR
jgi:hypothetical protein